MPASPIEPAPLVACQVIHPPMFKEFTRRMAVLLIAIPAERVQGLDTDPRVFLLDVTPTIVRHQLIASGVPDGAQAEVLVEPAFSAMEELGLESYSR